METPIPVPQTTMPSGSFPDGDAFRHRAREIGIIHRLLRMRADVIDPVSRAFQIFLDRFFRAESGVVGAHYNARFGVGICQRECPRDSSGIRRGIPI